jgi:hypothetical protein
MQLVIVLELLNCNDTVRFLPLDSQLEYYKTRKSDVGRSDSAELTVMPVLDRNSCARSSEQEPFCDRNTSLVCHFVGHF